jgi:ABC-type molybdate transport system ATPase subunit
MSAESTLLEVSVRLTRGSRVFPCELASTELRTAIQGPSGSGKTTLLRVIAGLEPRAVGRVRFAGKLWQDDARGAPRVPAEERSVGWVPQDSLLFPHLSVRANLLFSPRAREVDVRRLADWLEIGPLLDRSPRHLSGGERQRVSLGRALVSRPRLLLLDEAFSAVHRDLKTRLLGELARHCNEQGIAAVLVTHQTEDAAFFTGRSEGTVWRAGPDIAPA